MVLGRDHGKRVGLIAVLLEIQPGNLAENSGKATLDIGLVAHVRRLEQVPADLGRRRSRHLLHADDKDNPRGLGSNRLEPLVHGRRTGRTGVLNPGRALEAQIGGGLQHQRGGEVLRREARVEMAEQDLVHIARLNPGIRERIRGHPHDQAFDGLGVEFSKGTMSEPDDTGGHCELLPLAPCLTATPNFGRFLGELTSRGRKNIPVPDFRFAIRGLIGVN